MRDISQYQIECNNCHNTVAKTPTGVCPACKSENFGYPKPNGGDIPAASLYSATTTMSSTKARRNLEEYTIVCNKCQERVAKTPTKICPNSKCNAVNFGYPDASIGNLYKPKNPILQLTCRSCSTTVAKTPNQRCIVCSAHQWGYTEQEIAQDKVDTVKGNNEIKYAIEAIGLKKQYPNGFIGLHETTIKIPQGQFVVVMGPSGCGKSTLLKCLNAENPASHGEVKLFGQDLYKKYDQLKKEIGYVPQDDIVHKELSVEACLHYNAKLRLDKGTPENVIKRRIDDVLQKLRINTPEIRVKKVGELSGGQRKRVSIAVELLNDPSVLFLDEPTSPLDPETIDEFLKCIRQLSEEQNLTVIMVTHKPDDLKYADSLIFLGVKGYHVFSGSSSEQIICDYFGKKSLIDVYALLGNANELETVKQWYNKWYQGVSFGGKSNEIQMKKRLDTPFLGQLFWLTKRYAHIKWSDKSNIILLLAQPLIVALLLSFVFEKLQVGVLFLTTIAAIWFGVSNAAKEIVSELPIYKRERMYNLNILTYVFSKIIVLAGIALSQVFIFVTIIYMKYSVFIGEDEVVKLSHYGHYFMNMFYISFSSSLLGLALSAYFNTTEKVITMVPIFLMPQILLSGAISQITSKPTEVFSYSMFGRWGTEMLCRVQNGNGDTLNTKMYSIIPHPFEYPDKLTKQVEVKNAISELHLYNKHLYGFFDSYWYNLGVVSLINLLVFGLLIYFLKRHDTI